MIYSNNFSSSIQEKYSSPKCKIVGLKVNGLLCDSNYGQLGKAGLGFTNENTTSYEEDF